MKNLCLTRSSPEVVEACVMQAPQLPGLPAPVCLDMPDHQGAVWVMAGGDVADRIAVCVNTCNDLENEHLESNEVRHVMASLMTNHNRALRLLQLFVKNAYKIEHDSYHLQGHEDFDPEAALELAKEMIAAGGLDQNVKQEQEA